MNKKQFLLSLEKYLRKLPKNEKEEILQDYKEYFTIGVGEGKTESQIVKALGSPKQLASKLNAVMQLMRLKRKKALEICSRHCF